MNKKELYYLTNNKENIIEINLSLSSQISLKAEGVSNNSMLEHTQLYQNKQNMSLDNNNFSRVENYSSNKLRINNSTGGIIDYKFNKDSNYFRSNILCNNNNNEDKDDGELDKTVFINDEKNQSNMENFLGLDVSNNNNLKSFNEEYVKSEESDIDMDKYDIEQMEYDDLKVLVNKLNKKSNAYKEELDSLYKAKEEVRKGYEGKNFS